MIDLNPGREGRHSTLEIANKTAQKNNRCKLMVLILFRKKTSQKKSVEKVPDASLNFSQNFQPKLARKRRKGNKSNSVRVGGGERGWFWIYVWLYWSLLCLWNSFGEESVNRSEYSG
jgi:hypothetical protein